MYGMRFDMRLSAAAPARDQYQAALDMVAWAESRGGTLVIVSEHHGVPDGYLPSPAVLVSAMAARTTSTFIIVAAALLPLYDPVRLAEDICVVDHVSGGRVAWVLGLGYRREEFEMFGVDWKRRGAIADEKLSIVLQALNGVPFEYEGRAIHVTPATPVRPQVSWGGGSQAAARRAARFGLDFFGQTNVGGLAEAYREECEKLGRPAGTCMLPAPGDPTVVFVADDVDKAWEEIGPYLLRDATTYAAWNADTVSTASLSQGTTIDELRAECGAHRILTVEEAIELGRAGGMLPLHPLCGGIPAELAWPYLVRVAEEVEPAL
jgi:alkanesulfonate monooxygenase SsuD/methylene tetrahydromethanopterin reductase-like flavin-dependent oxidoreductase (luciferase family)